MENNITENLGFEDLNLNQNLLKGVYLYGFIKPSKIQISGINSINTGKDCLLQSQSGTGKTATYLLGILNRLNDDEKTCNAIILTPTRELGEQVYNVAIELSKFTKFKIVKCIGGTNITENKNLIKTANIIIGTIGRINHMIKEKRFNIHTVKLLVIDEADELFTDEIDEDLQFIFNKCPTNIQFCMISATMSQNVFNISKKLMHDPIKILLKNSEIAVELIKQYYINVQTEELKFETLLDLYATMSTYQTIIFCNTIRKVDWLKENLEKNNFVIACIHGKMTSEERTNIITDFRDGKTRILLTSDLLSRGVDIPSVNLVINYDLCVSKETYIHRIGRTSRVSNIGVAISMVKMYDQSDVKIFHTMQNHYNIKIKELPENIDQLFK